MNKHDKEELGKLMQELAQYLCFIIMALSIGFSIGIILMLGYILQLLDNINYCVK